MGKRSCKDETLTFLLFILVEDICNSITYFISNHVHVCLFVMGKSRCKDETISMVFMLVGYIT